MHPRQPTIPIMRDCRYNRRIVVKSQVLQNRYRPFCDREAGRAIAANGLACQVLETSLRTQYVRPELARRQRVDKLMTIPVRCQLMARRGNGAHQLRTFLGYPAEHEEGCTGMARIENFQYSHGISLDPQLAFLPDSTRDQAL